MKATGSRGMAMYFVIESTAMLVHLWRVTAQQFLLLNKSKQNCIGILVVYLKMGFFLWNVGKTSGET